MRNWEAHVRAHLSLPDLTPEREARVVRELAAQLEDFYRDALGRGLSDAEADAHASAQITDWPAIAGDVRRANYVYRQSRLDLAANALDATPGVLGGALQMSAHMLRDARFALRQLIKSPGFSVVAILTLALGVGATTSIFSVVNGVLLRPLPYPEPDALVRVYETVPTYGRFSVAPATFLDWQSQNGVFERITAYNNASGTLIWSDGPERVQGASASWDLFELLRVRPALGTGFTAEQDRPGANNVIVLSHGLWQRRFGGDPDIVGKSVALSGTPVTVLGVMPADFYFPARTTDYWRPLALNAADATRGGHFLGVVARTKAGVSVEQAHTEMKGISERLALQYAQSANESAEVIGLHEQIVGAIRPALVTLLIAVGVVVLIACANVANLLLVRASVREKEVAIRTALGAGRPRLVMQMLAESLVLSISGGALGLLLAYLAIPAIQTLSAGSIPRVAEVSIDGTVLAFTMLASVFTGIIFGLVPAWQISRGGTNAVLKEGGRSSVGAGGRWMRNALLVTEVALSLMLLVGAALLLRSFSRLTNVDPGFQPDGVLAFQVSLPQTTYPEDVNRREFFDRLLERLDALPSVTSAGAVQSLPMRGGYVLSVEIDGRKPATPGEEPSANYRTVTPDYFRTLGIPLKKGRTFTAQDSSAAAKVVIIDELFAQRHFANEDPIGRRLDPGNGVDGTAEIIGIVGNVNYSGLDEPLDPSMYVPLAQDGFSAMWILTRTDGDAAALSNTVRQVVRDLDRSLPVFSLSPLATVVSESVAQRRFSMLLLMVFSGVALFLAAVGLYGVVAYGVNLRTREIGLRMAIGAQPSDVLRMILGGGMKLALVGVVLGVAGALGLSQLVASLLFEVDPSDPLSYAATALLLLTVAALACYIPARRAMRVDPMVALQQD